MCNERWEPGCGCYTSQKDFDSERALIAHCSAIEHDVLALLRDATASASPLARRLAALIDADPADLDDIQVYGNGLLYWWTLGGVQHSACLDSQPALRVAA
ncbi:hypothetical protein [Paraburkholderia adhaesiva]|uniref:hypothetical protein n=1 Tax=Paraburkholderia adhaesiva TaxID=2883244 RepID=UPI001F15F146|nr:hypothetical protein [Paraburkholderia adhaesiva]